MDPNLLKKSTTAGLCKIRKRKSLAYPEHTEEKKRRIKTVRLKRGSLVWLDLLKSEYVR